jgi:truncated hemoglobin YjbI
MKPRKRHLTARIKPATRNAIMDQLALAADEIERLRTCLSSERADYIRKTAAEFQHAIFYSSLPKTRPWYARLMWWRK